VNGFLVPVNDAEQLASAVRKLTDHPELRTKFGAAGREIATGQFTEEVVIQKTLDVYKRALKMKGKRGHPVVTPADSQESLMVSKVRH